MAKTAAFSRKEKRLSWPLLAAILGFHAAAFYALALALAPDLTQSVTNDVRGVLTVSAVTPDKEPPPPPEVEPEPDEGEQGDPGTRGRAKPVEAPKPKIDLSKDKKSADDADDGSDANTGSQDQGTGPGSAGQGDGSGSGNGGDGLGNARRVAATKPSVRSGTVEPTDFPVPEGGRATRFGKSVTVVFTVTTDGHAKNCSVARTSVDAQTTGLACSRVIEKIRFNPATDQFGDPIEARYGFRVDFRAR